TFTPDASGALYWTSQRTLIVADLHLEKGATYARRGSMLPPYDTRATLTALADVVSTYAPERVIALGDSFHDSVAADLLADADLDVLRALQRDREWLWVTGNHDPALPRRVGGRVAAGIALGAISFVHQPGASR